MLTSTHEMQTLVSQHLLEECAAYHTHLCPRQILGLRIGMLGGQALGLEIPRTDKRLLTIIETDGCFADGVIVATGCSVGHCTLRVADFGKVAATFADVKTGQAIRITPRDGIRQAAVACVPDARSRWHAQLYSYQIIPDDELLVAQPVILTPSAEELLSIPGARTKCEVCAEEIINQREVVQAGRVLCRACAGQNYYCLP